MIRIPSMDTWITFQLDDNSLEAFQESRRKITRDLRNEMVKVGDQVVVPKAELRATYVRSISGQGTVIRKGRNNEVYLTTKKRGKLKDAVGYIEFGGTSETIIGPAVTGKDQLVQGLAWRDRKRRMSKTNKAHAGAIQLPNGQARRWVDKPRHFKGKHELRDTVRETTPEFQRLLSQRILRYFEREGFITE
jgi:hypothetical protein